MSTIARLRFLSENTYTDRCENHSKLNGYWANPNLRVVDLQNGHYWSEPLKLDT